MQGVRHNRWIEGLQALFRVSMNLAILEPSEKACRCRERRPGASFIKGLATIDQVSGLTDGEQRPFCSRASLPERCRAGLAISDSSSYERAINYP